MEFRFINNNLIGVNVLYKKFRKKQLLALIISGVLISHTGLNLVVYADSASGTNANVTTVQSVKVSEMTVGQTFSGFKLTNKTFSKDLNSEVLEFVHEKTGGKLVYLANEDKNKWFNVAFRTPAVDDTGVNHILEHAVLEGSEKFNFKSPFTEMSKRSVSTYMNAFTGSDVTSYPIASENDQDFQNLMSVYMDAAFSPVVAKNNRLLMQEGWRYVVDEKTGKISYNGVVFNEMKGALSDMYDTIYTELPSLVYPDTKYRYNSGGNPESIVDLSHAQLAATHKKYYNPTNACIMLYGKMNVTEKLKFIGENYYDKYTKTESITDNKEQKAFSAPKNVTMKYPADSSAEPETDSFLSYSLALNNTDAKDRLGLSILSLLICSGDNSPLYKNTVDQELGQSVTAELDTSYYQPMFNFMLEGANQKDMANFDKAVQATLQEMVKKGIDKERIQATLNSFELDFKASLLSVNKGEMALNAINSGFVTYGDSTLSLNQSEDLALIKKEGLEGKYFESLISKYLVGNKHLVKAVFVPDAQYMANINKNIDKKLAEKLKKMPKAELEALKAEANAYEAWQELPVDKEALKALPTLKISDLDMTPKEMVTGEKTISGTTVYEHPVNALGLTRVSMYFDLSTLTKEEMAYIDLFGSVLDAADTSKFDNEKLTNLINKYTGGFSHGASYMSDHKNDKQLYAYYTLDTIFAKEQSVSTVELLQELMTNAKLKDKVLIKTKLTELVEDIKDTKVNQASEMTSSRWDASINSLGALEDYRYNDGFKVLVSAEKNFDKNYPEIQKNLDAIYGKVFNKNNLKWSVASDAAGIESCEKEMTGLLNVLKSDKLTQNDWKIEVKKQDTGFIIPAEVQYINLGFNMKDIGEIVTGQDLVFSQILSDGYMYENIRLKGGAYGGYFEIQADGRVKFTTYRDPNLKSSVEVINGLGGYLKDYKVTQEEVDNAIITLVGRLELGQDLFSETAGEDVKKLNNFDKAYLERIKKEILATKASDLSAFTTKMEKGLKVSTLVVAGSETQIKANKNLFDKTAPIQE